MIFVSHALLVLRDPREQRRCLNVMTTAQRAAQLTVTCNHEPGYPCCLVEPWVVTYLRLKRMMCAENGVDPRDC